MERIKVKTLKDRLFDLIRGEHQNRLPDKIQDELSNERDGMTLEFFAKNIAGVSRQSLATWLKDDTNVRLVSLEKIANLYNVTLDWLLGYDDEISKEAQMLFKPFKDLGISLDAYNVLKELKEQGTDMNELLKGINLLLTYTVVGRKPITNDEFDLGTEREYIDITILPIINALNSYLFSLYEEGGYTRLTTKKFHDIVDWASNYNPSESAYDEEQEELIFLNLFEKGIKEESPEFSEITLLNVLDHELKKCKGLIIKEELQKVQAKVEKLDLNKMEKEDAWLPAISVILTHLDKFYNSN